MRLPYLAICDTEKLYAHRLAEYMNQNGELPLRVGCFTEMEELKTYAGENRVDVLLVSESMASVICGQLYSETVILLDEGSGDSYDFENRIYKYQPAKAILKEILKVLSESKTIMHGKNVNRQTKLYTFYSPVNRCLQTTTSYEFAKVLSEKQKVLFINLEAFSTLELLTERSFSENLSDLVYFSEQEINKFSFRLSSALQTAGKLDILPPVMSLEDIQEIEKEKWLRFFDKIRETHLYDAVVLDLGEPIKGFLDLLGSSHQVIGIIREDEESQGVLKKYERMLEFTGYRYINEVTRWIVLPKISEGNRNRKKAEIRDFINANLMD